MAYYNWENTFHCAKKTYLVFSIVAHLDKDCSYICLIFRKKKYSFLCYIFNSIVCASEYFIIHRKIYPIYNDLDIHIFCNLERTYALSRIIQHTIQTSSLSQRTETQI